METEHGRRRRRVGVVEGDPGTRDLIVRALEARSWESAAFDAVRPAVKEFGRRPPDLMILDADLPGCLGLIGAVLSESDTAVPAIVLSSKDDEQDFVRGFAAGAADCMAKPVRPAELIARCRANFARSCPPILGSGAFRLPSQNGLAFGRYRLVGELGKGGFGTVYLAEDAEDLGARVALKVPTSPDGLDHEARIRFIRESQALASVVHGNVVRVRDVGFEADVVYLAMEHVEGESLTLRVSRDGPMDEAEARLVTRGLLGALASLEEAGIVHRDVKPSNVILRGGAPEEPVLIDFGLAKPVLDRDLTARDDLLGTAHYMPPEVIRGHEPDARGDLYALGVTLWYALWGDEPYGDADGFDLLSAVTSGPVPEPPVRLSAGFKALVMSLCATDPSWRPHSAIEALAMLEDACRHAPSADRAPKSATRRQLRLSRKTRAFTPLPGSYAEDA